MKAFKKICLTAIPLVCLSLSSCYVQVENGHRHWHWHHHHHDEVIIEKR